jgi:hypothetical protein
MYAEFATDPKVQMLSESDQRRYLMLLCMRCSNEAREISGKEVAFILRISDDEAANTKEALTVSGLIYGDWFLSTKLEALPNRPGPHIWGPIRKRIFARDGNVCQYCGDEGEDMECDHVIPLSHGGSHDDSNLTTACQACNRLKGIKSISEWRGE